MSYMRKSFLALIVMLALVPQASYGFFTWFISRNNSINTGPALIKDIPAGSIWRGVIDGEERTITVNHAGTIYWPKTNTLLVWCSYYENNNSTEKLYEKVFSESEFRKNFVRIDV